MYKKTLYIKFILLATLLAFGSMTAQDKKTKKAKTDFNSYAYAEAIDAYEALVEKGYTSEEIFMNLGDAQYQKADYVSAAHWYGKLLELEDLTVDAEYFYKYAQTLKSTEKYKKSDQWMRKFSLAKANDSRAIKFAQNGDYLEKIRENSGRYDIKNLSINSTASDFAPSFNGNQLVFSTARDTGRVLRGIHKWNNKPFSNLYTAIRSENGEYTNAVRLSKKLNKKTHETSAAFTKDGSMVYFSRNNSENGKFARDKQGVSRIKVYRASLKSGEWTDVIELPFNSDDYSVAHPTLSPDETKLYFASDMPGTYGNSDIFVVDINSDGSFGTPKNLGNKINTESRETFPFLTSDNVLYFASDGHPGLGGLDVFATKLQDPNNRYIVNVGEPVNSKQDDFSFIIDWKSKKGFFASNRVGGLGSDDIYGFTEIKEIDLDCNTMIEGTVKDQETRRVLSDASISLVNSDGDTIGTTTSSADGSFSMEESCREGEYRLVAKKNEFDNGTITFTINKFEDKGGIEIVLEKTIKRAEVGTDLIKFLDLSPVYFDLDKSNIRPDAERTMRKIMEYLKNFPETKIEVRSHTDAKASNTYNERLSKRRAKATVDYLIKKGIYKDMINGIGLGETQLINDCTSRGKCEDAQHQLNRRSEFIVME